MNPDNKEVTTHSGMVAIVGRPNVGKSTLLNHLIEQKISITSRKPQTTRHQIMGVDTRDGYQIIFVDTPGLHKKEARAINRYMNRAAYSALAGIDAVVFVVDGMQWTDDDDLVLEKLRSSSCPTVLAINKIDKFREKEKLLPYIEQVSKKMNFDAIFPLSALRNINVKELRQKLQGYLPNGDFIVSEDYLTDKSERFLTAEIIREKIMRTMGDELPYSMTVSIERFKPNLRGVVEINAVVYVERSGQKRILIGSQGKKLKQIGKAAREDIEILLDNKVFLEIWVKIKSGWADDERTLRNLGYDSET
ncbi:MAG: GTPase Era [Pseudomonadota bacterium]